MFDFSEDFLLDYLNESRKKFKLNRDDVFGGRLKLSILKKIDLLFKAGLEFYLDPSPILDKQSRSVFFRKSGLNVDLSLGAKQRVFEGEQLYATLRGLEHLTGQSTERTLPIFSIKDDPIGVALDVATIVAPPEVKPSNTKRDVLKIFVNRLGEAGIYVHEFIDQKNKIEKANIDGAFIAPNFIIIKRESDTQLISREIFTLAHEFGHYLLNEEEAEEVDQSDVLKEDERNDVERWCDMFAFHYLLGSHFDDFMSLQPLTADNDFQNKLIDDIYNRTGLSKRALFYNLHLQGKLSRLKYTTIKESLNEILEMRRQKAALELEQEKASGQKIIRIPKRIYSEKVRGLAESAYLSGLIEVTEFKHLTGYTFDRIKKSY